MNQQALTMRTILVSLKCPKCGSGRSKIKYENPANRFEGENYRACLDCGTPFHKPASIVMALLFCTAGVGLLVAVLAGVGPLGGGSSTFRWIMLGLAGLMMLIGVVMLAMRFFFLRLSEKLIREGFDFGPPVIDVDTGKTTEADAQLERESQSVEAVASAAKKDVPNFWEVNFFRLTVSGWLVMLLSLISAILAAGLVVVAGFAILLAIDADKPGNKFGLGVAVVAFAAACGAGQGVYRFAWRSFRKRGKSLLSGGDP